MVVDSMVYYLSAVLDKYLDLYWASEMDLYLHILLESCFEVRMGFHKY